MTTCRATSSLTLTLALAALAACGDSSTAPRTAAVSDAQISADVAATAGDAAARDVGDFAADEAVFGGSAPSCPYDAASGFHVCTRVTERGLELVRKYQFRDASSTPTQNYDPSTTASIVFVRTADGSLSGTTEDGVAWTKGTHLSATRTVTGLAGAETQRVWNGTGTSADTATYTGATATRHYAASTSHTTTDVVVKLPRSTNPWPLSGTVTRTVNAKLTVDGARDASRTISRTAVVTFNGTSTVPITVNGLSCTLNLETQKVSGCTR